jgi:hypothetical protein
MSGIMECPKCRFEYITGATDCPKCGIIFEKYLRQQQHSAAHTPPATTATNVPGGSSLLGVVSGKTVLALAGVLVVAYVGHNSSTVKQLFDGSNGARSSQTTPGNVDLARFADENGFVQVPPPANQAQDTIYVLAAENCPKEDAQRADRLAATLANEKIPVVRTHTIAFNSVPMDDPNIAKRLEAVMNGPLPIVFVRGRAKGNPELEDVLAEYRKSN